MTVLQKSWRHVARICCILSFIILLVDCVLIYVVVQINLEGLVSAPAPLIHMGRMFTKTSNLPTNVTDVNKIVRNGTHTRGHSNKPVSMSNRTYKILYYNKPSWVDNTAEFMYEHFYRRDCDYRNCEVTAAKSNLSQFSAIIFCLTEPLDFSPPLTPSNRPRDQAWIFFGLESPVNQGRLAYRHNSWKNTMNWSMSYRLDSDIFAPYGLLQAREISPPTVDYSRVFRKKTKFAAWFVSNCRASSLRDEFVEKLRAGGVEVDVFGRCANTVFENRNKLSTILDKEYKFYFSFENSMCKDYVTEKLFRNYELNVVLVVRGGMDYTRNFPKDVLINTADFENVQEVTSYLLKVGSSEKLFTDYLKRKDRYRVVYPNPLCEICDKLNNIDEHRKVYPDIVPYMYDGKCWEPRDVSSTKLRPDFIKISIYICLLWTTGAVFYFVYHIRQKYR